MIHLCFILGKWRERVTFLRCAYGCVCLLGAPVAFSCKKEGKQPCCNGDYYLFLRKGKVPLDLVSAKKRGVGPEGERRKQAL